jgi:thiamine biosynthesis lipoprotein
MASDQHSVVCRRGAMNTLFEVVLVGADEENLRAAGEAALDEVVRVEKLLSRFDPASDTARINRDGHSDPVLVNHEMLRVLLACERFSKRTDGYFDVTAVSRAAASAAARTEPAVSIDPETRLVRIHSPGLFLDFGACGKGYAIDRMIAILREGNFEHALVHSGTSSLGIIGSKRVGIADPSDRNAAAGIVRLEDEALSCSAVYPEGSEQSDIVSPRDGSAPREQAACVVVMKGAWAAFESEMLSTGLLAMGRQRAVVWCQRPENRGVHVAWVDRMDGRTRMEWLGEAHE